MSARLFRILIVLAGVNMMVLHSVVWRTISQWDHAPSPPTAARVAGGLSLFFWIAVVTTGRWIPFA